MEDARLQCTYDETIRRFRKIPLMIFDDFLLLPSIQSEQQDLLILLHERDEDHTSTVLCPRVSLEGWHERQGSGGVADTLLDGSLQTVIICQSDIQPPLYRREAV